MGMPDIKPAAMLSPLDLKLLRDLGRMKGQVLAVSLVMACGLAMMIMTRSLILTLESTRSAYYQKLAFADVFGSLKRAPLSAADRLKTLPGVATVETRVVVDVTLDLPGLAEPATGRIVSLPEDGEAPMLNRVFLRKGRLPRPDDRREVLLGEAFADANGLQPGDSLVAVINGRRETLVISGIGLSPEFVFEARPGETLPDHERFSVMWMNYRALAVAYNMDGAFNDLIIDLAPGASPEPVIEEVDRQLATYGGGGVYTRKDHPSAQRLDDEIRVLHSLSVAYPLVFLSVAAFMVNAVLSRIVRLQREQIAQLKALGYSSMQVGVHFLKFVLVIGTLGTLIGGIGGRLLGGGLVDLYTQFFLFPSLRFTLDYSALGLALLVSLGASVLGVLTVVWQAVKLPPAEAMRPEPPAEFRPSVVERLGLQNLFGPSLRMAFRNIERRPWNAFFTAFGLALATGIPIVPGAMRDGINYLLDFQWDQAQRQDATITLIEPSSASVANDIANLPGVIRAEPFRSVPARLRFGHRSWRTGIVGLSPGDQLNRALDESGNPLPIPPDGLLISAKLAEILDVEPGESVIIEVQEGRRPKREAVVQGLITDYAGLQAYMDIDALRRLMQEGRTVSGAHVAVDASRWPEFYEAIKEAPGVANLGIKNAVRESFRKTTADSIDMIQGIYFMFSVIVAFGVVYNSARIALSERSRDLATLRVVGFSTREVAGVMIGELVMLTLVALPFGLWIGVQLANSIVESASTESVRLPLVLTHQSFATAILIVLASAGVSFAVVARRIRNLDLLGVLKARE